MPLRFKRSPIVERIIASRRGRVPEKRSAYPRYVESERPSVRDLVEPDPGRWSTLGDKWGDVIPSLASAGVGIAQNFTDLIPGGGASRLGQAERYAQDYWQKKFSPEHQAELDRQEREKEAVGTWSEHPLDRAGLLARQVIRNPKTSAAEMIGQYVPIMGVGGAIRGVGGLAAKAGAARGATAAGKALTKAGALAEPSVAAQATGAGLGVGAVRSGIFDSTLEALKSQGVPEAEAMRRAERAQAYTSNPALFAGAAVVGKYVAKFGEDAALLKLAGKKDVVAQEGLRALTDAAKGAGVRGLITGFGREALTEAPEEFIQNVASNVGARGAGALISPWKDAGDAAIKAGLMAGPMGSIGHVGSARDAKRQLETLQPPGTPPPGAPTGAPPVDTGEAPSDTQAALNAAVARVRARRLTGDVAPNFTVEDALTTPPEQIKLTAAEAVNDPRVQEIMSRFPTPSENKNDPALKALMDSGLMTGLAQAQKAIVRFRQGLTPLQLPGQSPVADEAQPVAPGEMALPGPVEAASAPEALPPGPVTEVQDQTLERGTEQGTQIGTEGQPAVAPLDQGARSEVSGADRVAEDRARTVSEEPIMKGRDAGESRGRPGALVADQAPKAVEAHAESVPAAIQAEAEKAEPEPTTAQKDAGNYTKGHIKWNGLDVSIETPRGGTRRAVDGSWTVENMPAHYGYVRRTEGADGEQVDIYMGDSPGSGRVFVVDQKDAETGKFDETKTMLGFNTPEAARAAYVAAFSDGKGPQRIQALTETTVDGFKSWLKAKHDGAFARKAPKIKIAPIKPKRAGKQDLGAALASDTLSPEMRAAIEEAKKNPQKGRMAEPRVAPKAKKAETVKPVNVEAATGLDTEQVATARADATALRKGINEAKGVATIQSAMSPFHFTDIQRYAPQIKYSELPKATKDLAKAGGRKPDTLKRGERGAVVARTGIRRSDTRGTSREDVIALDVQLEQLISDGWFPAGSTVDDLVNALVSKTPYYHPAETQGADAAVLANEVWKETGISPAAQATAIKQDKGNPKEVKILKALAELDPNDSQVQLEEKRADEPGDAQEDVRFSTERTKAGVQNLLPGAQGMMDTTGRVGKIKRKGQEDVSRGPLFTQDEEAEKKADAAKQTTLFAAGPFFSQLEKAAEAMKQPMRGADALRYLLDPQRAKPEETFWTGLDEWLGMEVSRPVQVKGQKGQQALVFKITDPVKAGRKVTPAEIQEFLKANAVTVTEVTKGATDDSEIESWWNDEGGANEETPFNDLTSEQVREARSRYEDEVGRFAEDGTAPKFGPNTHPSMSIPGGENYREVLLTLPPSQLKNRWKAVNTGATDEGGGGPWKLSKDGVLTHARSWGTRAEAEGVAQSHNEADQRLEAKKNDFHSGHWTEPNILAHVRLNDRVVDGARVLFVEEVQSDYGQAARRQGVAHKPTAEQARRGAELEKITEERDFTESEQAEWDALRPIIDKNMGGVPPAPFIERTEDWVNLALKSILHKAASEGYDSVAWTPGSVQAERYDLSKQISSLMYSKSDNGTYKLKVTRREGGEPQTLASGIPESKLEDHVGKDVAQKIVDGAGTEVKFTPYKQLTGLDLKVGGEGMKAFYDQIVPQVAQKLAKKWGAKVGTMNLAYPGGSDVGGQPIRRLDPGERTQEKVIVQSIPITTEMRSSVTQEGFPLFKAGEKAAPVPVTISKVRKAIPGLPWKAQPDGSFTAALKDGRTLKLDPNASFLSLTTKEQTGFERSATAAGGNASERAPVGAYTPFGLSREALIRVATAAPGGTLEHEGLHMLWDVALTPQEKASLVKRFGGEEEAAYAFATWLTAEQRKPQTLFQKVLDFVKRLVHYFKPTWESTFKEAASGRAAGRVGKSTGGAAAFAAAWHGSPHKFDKFKYDESTRGTGEGAQAYGAGLYFAESEGLGRYYRDQLSYGKDAIVRFLDEAVGIPTWLAKTITDPVGLDEAIADFRGRVAETKAQIADPKTIQPWNHEANLPGLEKILRAIEKVKARATHTIEPPGNLYHVDIPDSVVDRMLDNDKPLSDQSDSVKRGLEKLGFEIGTVKYPSLTQAETLFRSDRVQRLAAEDIGIRESLRAGWKAVQAKDVGAFHRWFNESGKLISPGRHNTSMGSDLYDELWTKIRRDDPKLDVDRAKAMASKQLSEAGIPGIKYLDGASRNKPLRDVKREFLAELPEDSDVEAVMDLIGKGTFSPKNEAILRALSDDGWLGFDYPAQALSAALSSKLGDFDPSPALVKAVAAAQEGGTRNFVVFDAKDVTILSRNGEKVAGQEKAKAIEGLQGQHPETAPATKFATAEADFEGDGPLAGMSFGTPRPPGTATLGYEPLANMEETFIEKLQHLFQNKLNSVRRLQETVKKTRPEKASKIDHEAAFIGVDPRAAAAVDNVGAVVITPMIELIHRKKLDQALLGRFSMAMHAPAADKAIIDENLIYAAELERDPPPGDTTDEEGKKIPAPQRAPFTVEEAIRELGPKRVKEIKDSLPPNPSGMSTERVAEILQKVKDSGKREAYEQARQMILDIQSITNQLRIRMGLTTAETVAQWEAKYGPDFVHLWNADKGVLESFMNSGRGVSVRGPEVLRRRGRRSEADAEPLISALQDLERTIIRSEKNRAVDDFATWVASLKEPQIAFVRKGEPTAEGVGFKRDGQQWTIEIPGDPRLLGQLKSLTTPQIDLMTNTLGHFTRYFSRINTAYSPPFLIRNGVRDYAGAIISSMILHGVKGHKGNKAVWREVMKNQYPAMKGAWNFQQDPAKQWPEGSWEAYAAEGVRLGAVPGFFNVVESMSKIEDRLVAELKKKMTAAELREMGVTEAKDIIADKNLYKIVKAGKLSKIAVDTAFRSLGLRAAGEMLLDANKMVEMATRINYFTALRKSGVAAKEAANLARNLTDFNKRGEFTSMLNSVWSFFNANVQGTVRIAEMMTSKDPAVKARANAMFAGLIGAGVMWDVMLAAISGDEDDDGIPDSDQMPQWATERNFVIPAMGNLAPILIPLAQGFNVPFFAGQMLSKAVRGVPGFSPGKAALSVMGAAADSWGPIGTKYGVPTAIQPLVEVLGNEDWAGRQVTPTRYPGMEGIPDSRLAWKWTSPMAKAAAEIAGGLTQGDETVPGLVDISPATIDHFARYFAGGAGRFMEDTVSSGLSLLEGETPEKVPGLSSFTLNEDSAKRARYYDQQRELSILGAQIKNKERVALTEEAEARGYDVGKATLSDLRKAITTLAPERQKWLLDSYRRLDARRLGLKDMMDAADKAVKELNSRPKTPQTEAALEAIYRRVNKAFVKASEGIR